MCLSKQKKLIFKHRCNLQIRHFRNGTFVYVFFCSLCDYDNGANIQISKLMLFHTAKMTICMPCQSHIWNSPQVPEGDSRLIERVAVAFAKGQVQETEITVSLSDTCWENYTMLLFLLHLNIKVMVWIIQRLPLRNT